LELQVIVLYEGFADGKLDKTEYIKAKSDLNAKLYNAKISLTELDFKLQGFEEHTVKHDDEPLLKRILDSEDLTKEMISPIDKIIVYDPERIEIRFDFGDTNI